MSFIKKGLLVNDLLEQFAFKENIRTEKSSAVSEEIKKQLKTNFTSNLSPKMKIQRGEEEIETEIEPIQFLAPIKKRRNRRNLWLTKRKFFTNGIKN